MTMDETADSVVMGVSRDRQHRFSKQPCESITLLEGLGVEGDAHAGITVQHRSRVAADPTQPNLRQVHLIPSEFFDEAREQGYELAQGDLGENVLTAGLDVLALPRDTRLHLGEQAVVRVTGLRNPCQQINDFRSGLLKVAITRDANGELVRRAGIMGVVERGGVVAPSDTIRVELPPGPHIPLDRV
jgi:MOSC domain-containing protein YiiM